MVSCKSADKSNKNTEEENVVKQAVATPPVIIYKTKKDYSENVPVVLNDEGTKIASYPSPRDVFYKGKLAYPEKLCNGFLLDKRGINANVAFLDYTYEKYSKLQKTPSTDELWDYILEKDPLEEIYRCGSKGDYSDLIPELNKIIESGDFSKCQKLN